MAFEKKLERAQALTNTLIEIGAPEKLVLDAYAEEQRIERAQDKCLSDPIVTIMLKHHRQQRFTLVRRLPGPQHCEG